MNPLQKIVTAWSRKFIVVSGDLCQDHWVEYETTARTNPESPGTPVWSIKSQSTKPGMTVLVARMVQALNAAAKVAAGPGENYCNKIRATLAGKPLARIDQNVQQQPARLGEFLSRQIGKPSLVLLCDHGYGSVDRVTVEGALAVRKKYGCPVIVDPARGADWGKYEGVDCVKANEYEWNEFQDNLNSPADGLTVVVTVGAQGCGLMEAGQAEFTRIGTAAVPGAQCNPVGAGDQFLAALGLARVAGATWTQACKIANAAARVKCRKERTRECMKDELLKELEGEGG